MSEALAAHARSLVNASLKDLFAHDPSRVTRLTLQWDGFHVDLSKERLSPSALDALQKHADAIGVVQWIEALFAGERVNLSEARPALHTALRQPGDAPIRVAGDDIMPAVRATRQRIRAIAQRLRSGEWHGATGQPIRHVVSIGIGGSDLGPRLACDALRSVTQAPVDVAFVSNVDPEAIARALAPLDAASTLVIVISKTFTTQETLANAHSARQWLVRSTGVDDVSPHFIGVTGNVPEAARFGVAADNVLPMWDWVGGRYSLWSAVGLPVAIACGEDLFDQLLAGAAAMDRHVRTAPPQDNLAIVLGLVAWWNARWLGLAQRLVIPYAHALRELPAYLQQLSLESNGKRVTRDGSPLNTPSAPSLWGSTGTDAQHSFFQWLHQGTHPTPVEFVVPVRASHPLRDQQTLLVANALAQSQALLIGRSPEQTLRELAGSGLSSSETEAFLAARVCPGNRSSTTILVPTLDAWHLGALLALYEHRTYVESLLFEVNAFDQWGVELGKTLAKPIAAALAGDALLPMGTDASTESLVAAARRLLQANA
ncbi:MAG TPA: glucose-6-phosphate isomerase [Casimicrobiaceae bacterium]|nr:glucose-6-phosphate isomerase [Casimicrobiaceae bacterium]